MSNSGFTLIELLIVVAIAAVLAGVALPTMQGRELRMARLDAVQALTRVQQEEERFRALHGRYTDELNVLRGVTRISAQGRYTLSLRSDGAERYQAVASPLGAQQRDRACPSITLDVNLGFASYGPALACWGR